MKKLIVGLLILSGLSFGVASQASAVTELCPKGTGGFTQHISGDGKGDSFTYTAPAGKLVAELCVKAGTTTEYTTYLPPQPAVTVDHSVKDSVSHFAVRLVDKPPATTTTVPETTVPDATPPPYTPPTELPETGGELTMAAIAMLMLAGGGGLVLATRRG